MGNHWFFLPFALLCLLGLGVGVKIELLIRAEYPEMWRKLGFPSSHPLSVQPQDENRHARAQIALMRLIWKKEGVFTSDLRLARLRRAHFAVFTAFIFIFMLFLAKKFLLEGS